MFGLLILILINGFFSMAEIAVVSARKARLKLRAEHGDKGAQSALALANEPEDFLATIQIGITLVAILMGAVGSIQIAALLEPLLVDIPVVGKYAFEVAEVTAVILITYLSLVLGELAPKQIGLNAPENIAGRIAPAMTRLAWLAHPIVRFLNLSTQFVMRLLRVRPSKEPAVTEAEIQMMLEQGAEDGVVEPIEGEIVEQLFRVGDLHVNDLMVDRTDIVWLNVADSLETIKAKISADSHSRYPVARGDLDNIIGLVFVKDLLVNMLAGGLTDLELLVKPALFIPSGLPVYQMLERFKEAQAQIAFVTDEHGGVEGLVTFMDLLEAIVGDVPEVADPAKPTAVRRADGSWLIDGKLPIEEFKQLFNISKLPEESENYYQTVGGFVMSYLRRIPAAGDTFTWQKIKIEVIDMDWRRVDKVLVTEA
ncbi:MAG: HlyC/CorC family transporter [Anaerolineae bacterium]|nr:HlyC/CorC family transporter [Anaerolineae bacterium]